MTPRPEPTDAQLIARAAAKDTTIYARTHAEISGNLHARLFAEVGHLTGRRKARAQ
jgi:hypothetical protein